MIFFRSVSFFLFLSLISSTFITKAYQSISNIFTFPEQSLNDIKNKLNIGLTFSGGGDRAYIATIGYLSGLHELNLISNIKYIAGSSGGSWATVVYSYYQNTQINDTVMLGRVVLPEEIIFENLKVIEEGCVRSYVNSSYILQGPLFSDWLDAIQVTILSFHPSSLSPSSSYSINRKFILLLLVF